MKGVSMGRFAPLEESNHVQMGTLHGTTILILYYIILSVYSVWVYRRGFMEGSLWVASLPPGARGTEHLTNKIVYIN